jgi:isoquinoline 1-oxidoreductase beta subunit
MTGLNTHSKFVIANVSRRNLLKGVAATGGLVLAAQFPTVRAALAAYPTGADAMPNGVVNNPKVFIAIDRNGIVSIVAARAEMGKVRPAPRLPMFVGELTPTGRSARCAVAWRRAHLRQQDTDGSRSAALDPADAPLRRRQR